MVRRKADLCAAMLIRHTLLTLPGQVAGPLAMMAAAIVWTHLLDPHELGTYALVWASQELVCYVALGWWSGWIQRFLTGVEGDDARGRLERAEWFVQIVAAALQVAVALAVLWVTIPAALTPSLAAATAAFVATRGLTHHFVSRTRAEFRTAAFTVLQACGPVLGLAFGAAAAAAIEPTAEILLWSYAAAQLLGLLVAWPLSGVRLARPWPERVYLRPAAIYGAPLVASSALEWSANHGIRFAVEAVEGAAAVGLMTVGWWLGVRLLTFVALLVTGAAFNVAVESERRHGREAALAQLGRNGTILLGLLARRPRACCCSRSR